MWHALQLLTVFAVIASNIKWEWTPNPYLAALLAGLAAYLVTKLLAGLFWAAQKLLHHKTPSHFLARHRQ